MRQGRDVVLDLQPGVRAAHASAPRLTSDESRAALCSGDIQDGNNVCPGSPTTAFHANDASDVAGCAMGITYNANADTVKPDDFTIFSVNHQCPWTRFTEFKIPAGMPACPEEGCICGWYWIHREDSGSAQSTCPSPAVCGFIYGC